MKPSTYIIHKNPIGQACNMSLPPQSPDTLLRKRAQGRIATSLVNVGCSPSFSAETLEQDTYQAVSGEEKTRDEWGGGFSCARARTEYISRVCALATHIETHPDHFKRSRTQPQPQTPHSLPAEPSVEQPKVPVSKGMFKCPRCHSDETTYTQAQLRSGDEGYTTFVTCLRCDKHWTFN